MGIYLPQPVERLLHPAAVTVRTPAVAAVEVKVPLAAAERIARNAVTTGTEILARVAGDGVLFPVIHVAICLHTIAIATLIFDLVCLWVVPLSFGSEPVILFFPGHFEAILGRCPRTPAVCLPGPEFGVPDSVEDTPILFGQLLLVVEVYTSVPVAKVFALVPVSHDGGFAK